MNTHMQLHMVKAALEAWTEPGNAECDADVLAAVRLNIGAGQSDFEAELVKVHQQLKDSFSKRDGLVAESNGRLKRILELERERDQLKAALEVYQIAENNRRESDNKAEHDYTQHIAPLQDEIAQLKNQLHDLQQERDALKKALEAASKGSGAVVLTKTKATTARLEAIADRIIVGLKPGQRYGSEELWTLGGIDPHKPLTAQQAADIKKIISAKLGEDWRTTREKQESGWSKILYCYSPKKTAQPEPQLTDSRPSAESGHETLVKIWPRLKRLAVEWKDSSSYENGTRRKIRAEILREVTNTSKLSADEKQAATAYLKGLDG